MPAIVQGGAWNIRTSRQRSADLEVLKSHVNADYMVSIVLDASAVAPDVDGVRRLKAGTLLSKNSNGQYERFTAAGAGNEVTTLAVDATGGDFTLTVDVAGDVQTTAAIAENALAAAVEAAIEALPNVTNVSVTGTGTGGDPFVITFLNPASQDVTVTADDTNLTGGTSAATVGTTTEGDTAQAIRGVLATTHEFPDNLSHSDAQSQMWNHGQVFRVDRIIDWATHGAAARAALPTCRFD